MTIATIALLSIAFMQNAVVRGNIAGGRLTQATFLAQGMLERIKDTNAVAGGVAQPAYPSGPDRDAFLDSGMIYGVDERGSIGGPFQLQWQVAAFTEWSKKVTVTVSWNSIVGRKRFVSLSSVHRSK